MLASISAAALISRSWNTPHLRLQRDVLAVAVVADAVEDELLGDERRDVGPEIVLDHVEHQVERRDAAGARVAVAVDREELRGELDPRKLLAQRGHVLPVDRGAVLVEEPRLGERVAAGAKRAQRDLGAARAGAAR